MKLSEKKLLILTIVIPGAIALCLAVLGYFAYHRNSVLSKEVKETEQKIKEAKEIVIKMQSLDEKIAGYEKERADLEKQFPTKEEISLEKFINTLTRLSKQANVHLANAAFEQLRESSAKGAKTASIFDKISYKLQLEGTFFDLMTYVYLLETYERFIKVEKFTIGKGKKGGKSDILKYKLDISITSYIYDKYKK